MISSTYCIEATPSSSQPRLRAPTKQKQKRTGPSCYYCRINNLPGWDIHYLRTTPHWLSPIACPVLQTKVCTLCSKMGHVAEFCLEKCTYCMQKGHTKTTCKRNYTCKMCGIRGHVSEYCRTPMSEREKTKQQIMALQATRQKEYLDYMTSLGREAKTQPLSSIPTHLDADVNVDVDVDVEDGHTDTTMDDYTHASSRSMSIHEEVDLDSDMESIHSEEHTKPNQENKEENWNIHNVNMFPPLPPPTPTPTLTITHPFDPKLTIPEHTSMSPWEQRPNQKDKKDDDDLDLNHLVEDQGPSSSPTHALLFDMSVWWTRPVNPLTYSSFVCPITPPGFTSIPPLLQRAKQIQLPLHSPSQTKWANYTHSYPSSYYSYT